MTKKEAVVLLGKEAGLAVIPALDEVNRQPSGLESGLARHDDNNAIDSPFQWGLSLFIPDQQNVEMHACRPGEVPAGEDSNCADHGRRMQFSVIESS